MSIQPKRVHFPPEQMSGSHRPPEEFRSASPQKHTPSSSTVYRNISSTNSDTSNRISTIINTTPLGSWFQKYEPTCCWLILSSVYKAQFGAIYTFGASLLTTIVKAIQFIFTAIFYSAETSQKVSTELKIQWTGLRLSAIAISNPIEVIDSLKKNVLVK